MRLFLFLNDLAGRFPFLDDLMRGIYITAVPLLATLFGALLLLFPRAGHVSSRLRVVLAVVFSLLTIAFFGLAVQLFAETLGLGTISPRPFMTRRVDLLVVEPQDNSFPCFEMALAAAFAIGIAFLHRKWGIVGGALTILLGIARLFCGNNYFADVAVGALIGGGVAAAMGALFEVPLRVFENRLRWQALSSGAVLLLTLGGAYVSLAATPRFAAKLPLLWASSATAATTAATTASTTDSAPDSAPAVPLKPTRAARAALQEGEGVVEADVPETAEELALSKRSHLFLPVAETSLKRVLAPLARPFRLLDVEVAPVKAGDKPYRCAALRFEIPRRAPELRRRTTLVAARLVKAAFGADSQLQNVDITAIVRGGGLELDGTTMRFAGDEVPVFTASIQRKNLIVKAPRWANDPRLDAGSWLRTRSRLYINERVMPPSPASRLQAQPVPFDAPKTQVLSPAIPLEDEAK